jgi:hypothetical protein
MMPVCVSMHQIYAFSPLHRDRPHSPPTSGTHTFVLSPFNAWLPDVHGSGMYAEFLMFALLSTGIHASPALALLPRPLLVHQPKLVELPPTYGALNVSWGKLAVSFGGRSGTRSRFFFFFFETFVCLIYG